jgi:hypothetical protein
MRLEAFLSTNFAAAQLKQRHKHMLPTLPNDRRVPQKVEAFWQCLSTNINK